jgi:DNA-binding response OmpR family regulator
MISRLRKKLSPLGENPIKAAHGKGYVFTQNLRIG